ncbi:MAG: PilZ domain-containing protein [Rhizobiales bacterium]|nr:PilZ domain-containing protein [Hyphomicrobiales bacterium]
MTEASNVPERRAHERGVSDENATVLYPNGRTRVPCRLLDRSAGGVSIRVSASAHLPAEFILLTGPQQTRSVCRIAWRIGSQAGLEFIEAFTEAGEKADWALPITAERAQKVVKSRLLKRPLIIN